MLGISVSYRQRIKMGKVSLRLNKGRKTTHPKKKYPIYLRYVRGREIAFDVSLKISVLACDWNEKDERVKSRSHLPFTKMNEVLTNWKRDFEDFDLRCTNQRYEPTYSEVRDFFEMKSGKVKPVQKKHSNLIEYMRHFEQTAHKRINPRTSKPVSKGTIRNYSTSVSALVEFNQHFRTDFDTINKTWYDEFVHYHRQLGLSTNYIGKHIKTLKTILREAELDGYDVDQSYKRTFFKVLTEEVNSVYLTTEELGRIATLDLSNHKRHDRARDIFLIGALTGLRISDYNYLKPANLVTRNGELELNITQQKTGDRIVIPISNALEAILRKYNYQAPKRLPDQTINILIKDVAEWAGIDDTIWIKKMIKGKVVELSKPKFKEVKSHTARRSFCTNAYLNDMPLDHIKMISGHKTQKALLRYIKVEAEQRSDKIRKSSAWLKTQNLPINGAV